ncbi:efflux transporter outer membrane subunit [Methylovorus menthalis]|uniref:efflux transporter outer membrane subunit n=1 Tax=Methylovorus menthalis TaxID=1002227 RepID=UPI001E2D04CA|nr:efflux transporter outer membrane subunit [Methylovorus menthalis]MCB4812035.1 efflux transporter outer membrane subunit [Methylovorus menthalis]
MLPDTTPRNTNALAHPDAAVNGQHLPSRHLFSALLACSLAMLPGCISMRGIEPQAKPVQASQLDLGNTVMSAAKIEWPTAAWWQDYHDAQLDALVARTISDNPDLKAAQARIGLAQAYADSMHAQTLPTLSGDTTMTREKFTELQFIPSPSAGHTDWNNRAALTLAYDLDLWGRQKGIWAAALDETHVSAAEMQQVRLELVNAVVRSYIRLAFEFQLHGIAEEHVHEVEHRVAIVRRARAAGLATELAVAEAEVPLPVARMKVQQIEARIALIQNQLAALSGQASGGGEKIHRPAMHYDASIGLPDQLPANLIGRRPDILASRWRIEASREYIASAKASFYPNINLLAFAGFQALGFGRLFSNAATIAGVGPAISLPIFDGGRRRANLSAQTASYDIAVEHYNASVLKALENISNQLVLLNANEREMKNAEEAMATAEKAHALSLRHYQAGLTNYEHVLVTHEVVLMQRETMVQLEADKLDAHAGLMLALGGGLNDDKASQAISDATKEGRAGSTP